MSAVVTAVGLSENTPRIRVLCVDDHHLVLEGIVLVIERQPDLQVVGAPTTGEEAVRLFRLHRPDVTLIELRLRGMSGLDVIGAIRREDSRARIIVVATTGAGEDIHRALQAGAATYVLKDSPSTNLIQAIRGVHAGQQPMSA